MTREPYDYHQERRIVVFTLTGLITVLVLWDAWSPEFVLDTTVLFVLAGMILAALGLGPLLRSLR